MTPRGLQMPHRDPDAWETSWAGWNFASIPESGKPDALEKVESHL